jgi:hypothetical protein
MNSERAMWDEPASAKRCAAVWRRSVADHLSPVMRSVKPAMAVDTFAGVRPKKESAGVDTKIRGLNLSNLAWS